MGRTVFSNRTIALTPLPANVITYSPAPWLTPSAPRT